MHTIALHDNKGDLVAVNSNEHGHDAHTVGARKADLAKPNTGISANKFNGTAKEKRTKCYDGAAKSLPRDHVAKYGELDCLIRTGKRNLKERGHEVIANTGVLGNGKRTIAGIFVADSDTHAISESPLLRARKRPYAKATPNETTSDNRRRGRGTGRRRGTGRGSIGVSNMGNGIGSDIVIEMGTSGPQKWKQTKLEDAFSKKPRLPWLQFDEEQLAQTLTLSKETAQEEETRRRTAKDKSGLAANINQTPGGKLIGKRFKLISASQKQPQKQQPQPQSQYQPKNGDCPECCRIYSRCGLSHDQVALLVSGCSRRRPGHRSPHWSAQNFMSASPCRFEGFGKVRKPTSSWRKVDKMQSKKINDEKTE